MTDPGRDSWHRWLVTAKTTYDGLPEGVARKHLGYSILTSYADANARREVVHLVSMAAINCGDDAIGGALEHLLLRAVRLTRTGVAT